MKKILRKPLLFILGATLMMPAALLAQNEGKDKEKDKKGGDEVIIIRKGDKAEKVVVEVNGDQVTVNGKPLDEYKGEDVTVRKTRIKDPMAFSDNVRTRNFGTGINLNLSVDTNRAMLGVTTEKAEKGVEIQEITNTESAAAKAGLKTGDVITRIDDKKIETPDDLSKAVKAHKPGDKIGITYFRDDKEQKTTAVLSRWKGANAITNMGNYYNFDLGNMEFDKIMPKIQTMPRFYAPYGQDRSWPGAGPRLGLSVQDTDDGKGVKVIEVDDEGSAYKAGIKEDDLITEVDGKATNSADEIAKIIKESKEKNSVMIKLLRGGKTQNVEVKIPRKLKTADL